MKLRHLSFIVLLITLSACGKTKWGTYACTTPNIILQQAGYDHTEWDTIITYVYEPGFSSVFIIDTFVTETVNNELLIAHDVNNPKDYEIFLPSVNRSYKVYDIKDIPKTAKLPVDQPDKTCYNDISFFVDGEEISGLNSSGGTVYTQLKK